MEQQTVDFTINKFHTVAPKHTSIKLLHSKRATPSSTVNWHPFCVRSSTDTMLMNKDSFFLLRNTGKHIQEAVST